MSEPKPVYPPAWPDAALEKEMLADGLPDQYGSISSEACHIRALLTRVRQLEQRAADGALMIEACRGLQNENASLRADKERWRGEIRRAVMFIRDIGSIPSSVRILEMLLGES